MVQTYDRFDPVFVEPSHWTIAHALRTNAKRYGDKVFLESPFEGVAYTYSSVLEVAERLGGGLQGLGLTAGDRLLIMSENRADYVLAWFGAALAGIAEVPLNTAYSGRFLAHQVSTVAPAAAVIEPQFAEHFVAEREASASIQVFVLLDAPGRAEAESALRRAGWRTMRFEDLGTSGRVDGAQIAAHDLASIFFTSGTTGLSKGVMMSQAHMHFFAEEWAAITRLTSEDTYFTCLPLFHGNAQFVSVYPALIAGARIVIEQRFSASRWVTWLGDYEVTVTNLMGVMMEFLWKQPPGPNDSAHRLRCVNATPTASTLEAPFKKRFGVETIVEGFGTTEISSPIATPYSVPRPAGSCGLALDQWFDIALLDPDTDRPVPVGDVGELAVRPKVPWITSLGYYGMPEKTLEATRNLWFRTGDTMRRDEAGWYFFADRIKDALRRRGENISSYEVELAVLEYDSVRECAVIGVPADEHGGEDEVMAVVVPRERSVTAAELWEFCDGRLPAFAVPRYLRFVEDLPKTATQKVEKAKLRAEGIDTTTFDRQRQ